MPQPVNGLLDELFPRSYADNHFPAYCEAVFARLAALMPAADLPRVPGWQGPAGYAALLQRYGIPPTDPSELPLKVVEQIVEDFLAGTVNWRCPELQYNLGAAVNIAAAAAYAIALDLNVYLINDGLAGNCIAAENAVGMMLAHLAGLPLGRSHDRSYHGTAAGP